MLMLSRQFINRSLNLPNNELIFPLIGRWWKGAGFLLWRLQFSTPSWTQRHSALSLVSFPDLFHFVSVTCGFVLLTGRQKPAVCWHCCFSSCRSLIFMPLTLFCGHKHEFILMWWSETGSIFHWLVCFCLVSHHHLHYACVKMERNVTQK